MDAVILSSAEQDIQSVYVALFAWSERRADLFLETVAHSLGLRCQHPELGRRFSGSSLRSLSLHPFPQRLFYRRHGRRLMIGAVLDMRQDPAALIRQLQARTLLDD